MMSRIEFEYRILARHLPDEIPSILDIGCGNGGMAAMFATKKYTRTLHLLEGQDDDLGPKQMRYNPGGTKPWRTPEKAVAYIKRRAPHVDISTYTPSDPWPDRVDLVISLWSWGFHYPIQTYLKRLERIEAPLVLLDLRMMVASKSVDILKKAGYPMATVINSGYKAARVLCAK